MGKEKKSPSPEASAPAENLPQTAQPQVPAPVAEIPKAKEALEDLSITTMLANPQVFQYLERLASNMATAKSAVPDHLRTPGDCLAIIIQSAKWKMDPFAVAQKTHIISGKLGYEAQLVNAVVTSCGAIRSKFVYDWFGPWEKVVGKFRWVENPQKKTKYQVPNWTPEDEEGCGIRVSAVLTNETEPRKLELLLVQASVRNSTLWASDPKQQLAYLAVKRWARLYAPETILGVYTRDELEEVGTPPPKNITPVAGSQSENLVNVLKNQEGATVAKETEVVPPGSPIHEGNKEFIRGLLKSKNITDQYFTGGLQACFNIMSIDEIPIEQFENVTNWIKNGCPAM